MLIGKYPLKEGTITYDFSPSTLKTVYENIKYIAFRDTYGSADANYYYQQRWNTHDHDDVPLVRDMLGEVRDEKLKQELFELFRIEPMLDKPMILLSSGELRKFQLVKALERRIIGLSSIGSIRNNSKSSCFSFSSLTSPNISLTNGTSS